MKLIYIKHQDPEEYREWDLLPRITICKLKGEGTAFGFGWLIWGIVIAGKFNKKIKY